jgi:hypothetical protein
MYTYGTGVKQDHEEALHWYTIAAQKDNSDAQANLGNMYLQGDGVNVDYEKAYFWLLKSANQGDPIAIFNIGQMFAISAKFPQNNVMALAHYQIASSIENEFSQVINEDYNTLKSHMSPGEIQAAEQEAKKLMHEYGIE